MTKLFVLAGASLILLSSPALAQSEANPLQGSPNSAFPLAAPNEVEIINGVPCRTVLQPGTNRRIPVECKEPGTTGSVRGGGEGPPSVSDAPVYPPPQ